MHDYNPLPPYQCAERMAARLKTILARLANENRKGGAVLARCLG